MQLNKKLLNWVEMVIEKIVILTYVRFLSVQPTLSSSLKVKSRNVSYQGLYNH